MGPERPQRRFLRSEAEDQSREHLEQALELTEQALSEVTKIAVELIRGGMKTSVHIDAAERELRSAMRQLVLAQRQRPAPNKRAGS